MVHIARPRCQLHVACCQLRVACCQLRVAYCQLRVACCQLRAARCLLPVARCLASVACCMLRVQKVVRLVATPAGATIFCFTRTLQRGQCALWCATVSTVPTLPYEYCDQVLTVPTLRVLRSLQR